MSNIKVVLNESSHLLSSGFHNYKGLIFFYYV